MLGLSEEQRAIVGMAEEFVEKEITLRIDQWDKDGTFVNFFRTIGPPLVFYCGRRLYLWVLLFSGGRSLIPQSVGICASQASVSTVKS